MVKLNNSVELLDFIKEVAKNPKNWKIEGKKLSIRLAFGAKMQNDVMCTPNDFKSDGNLSLSEMKMSREKKNNCREKAVAKKSSIKSKQDLLDIDEYLSRLYNDEESPFSMVG